MEHRHIVQRETLSSAAIDDIIDRGGRDDWAFLRHQADTDDDVMRKIARVCQARCVDPYAQRYHLWSHYARYALA